MRWREGDVVYMGRCRSDSYAVKEASLYLCLLERIHAGKNRNSIFLPILRASSAWKRERTFKHNKKVKRGVRQLTSLEVWRCT